MLVDGPLQSSEELDFHFVRTWLTWKGVPFRWTYTYSLHVIVPNEDMDLFHTRKLLTSSKRNLEAVD